MYFICKNIRKYENEESIFLLLFTYIWIKSTKPKNLLHAQTAGRRSRHQRNPAAVLTVVMGFSDKYGKPNYTLKKYPKQEVNHQLLSPWNLECRGTAVLLPSSHPVSRAGEAGAAPFAPTTALERFLCGTKAFLPQGFPFSTLLLLAAHHSWRLWAW